MPFDVFPEPPEDVRAALDRLLERELDRDETQSAWWLAGVRESIEDGEAD